MDIVRLLTWVLPVAIAGCMAAGCSLFTSFDGLTGGGGAAEPDDGSVAPVGASDAGATASPHDASLRHDASESGATPNPLEDAAAPPNDSGAIPESGATGYCASLSPAPRFCDDFDESTSLSKWDSTGSVHGLNNVSSAQSTSPSQSVASSSVAVSTGQVVDVGLYKLFPALTGIPRVETLSFDMYIDVIDSAHAALAVVGALAMRNTTGGLHELQFVVTLNNGKVVPTFPEYTEPGDGGATGYVAHGTTTTLSLKTWTRVTIELSMGNPNGGAGNAARLLFDGVQAATIGVNLSVSNPAPQLVLGLSYVSPPSDGWTVRYDNVTFDTTP